MIFHILGWVCIHIHFSEVLAKPKGSRIVGFKEYLKNFPFPWLPKDISFREGEEQEEALKGEDSVSKF